MELRSKYGSGQQLNRLIPYVCCCSFSSKPRLKVSSLPIFDDRLGFPDAVHMKGTTGGPGFATYSWFKLVISGGLVAPWILFYITFT